MAQDVIADLRAFLKENFMMDEADTLGESTSFMENHILDSTGFIELITFVEEHWGVQVDDTEMVPENFDSLRNIDAWLARKRAGPAS